MKKISALILAVLFLIILVSCSESEPEASSECAVMLSKSSLSFTEVGEYTEIDFYVIDNGKVAPELAGEVEWTTSDTEVAICEGNVITATGYGSCTIRATYGTKYAICIVQIPNPNSELTISHTDVVLDNIGDEGRISAFSETGEEISYSIEWYSSNENIVYCENGKLLAVGYGSCTVTARSKTLSAVCTVTVNDPTAPSVSLSKDALDLALGESYTLTAQTRNNAGKIVSWMSTDDSIATCTDGVVTAHSRGTCAILAISEKGYSGFAIVKVGNPQKDTSHEEYLDFEFKNLGYELKYVDKTTGIVESAALIYDYELQTQLLADGRLVMEIYLLGVKTYDMNGIDGNLPCALTASIYKEEDAFCDKRQYRTGAVRVGETFRIKCSGFTVQTNTDGTQRELYMTFSRITEHQQIS